MAKSASVVSDSDGKAREASEPVSDKATDEERENGVEDDEDEEEYEIEEILDHSPRKFEGKRMGFLCKWKGYGPEHNSWVDEEDAGNATELIEIYWKKQNAKKAGRKSGNHSTKKGRASVAADSPEPISAAKKRGRKSVAAKDDDEETDQTTKRQKTKTNARKKHDSAEPEDVVMEDSEEQIAGVKHMKEFMRLDNWENIVEAVDTVEKPSENGPLLVYFRLTEKNGGTRVRLNSDICTEKFPRALIRFYESNLKWKETEVDD